MAFSEQYISPGLPVPPTDLQQQFANLLNADQCHVTWADTPERVVTNLLCSNNTIVVMGEQLWGHCEAHTRDRVTDVHGHAIRVVQQIMLYSGVVVVYVMRETCYQDIASSAALQYISEQFSRHLQAEALKRSTR